MLTHVEMESAYDGFIKQAIMIEQRVTNLECDGLLAV